MINTISEHDDSNKPHAYINSLNDVEILNNSVLVKLHERNFDRKKNGIYVSAAHSVIRLDHNVNRIFEVIKCPEKLTFSEYHEDNKDTMDWKTEMELQEGDLILADYHAAEHATRLCVNEEDNLWKDRDMYKLIRYQDIIAIKRGGEYIVANGYVLMEEVKEETKILAYIKSETTNKYGIVRRKGKMIERYRCSKVQKKNGQLKKILSDYHDVEIGDKVIVRTDKIHVVTEKEPHNVFFNGDIYFYTHRRNLVATVND